MVWLVKAFGAIFNTVVMELQRTKGAKVRLTLEVISVRLKREQIQLVGLDGVLGSVWVYCKGLMDRHLLEEGD
jgi:hypothetical protein